MLPIVNLRFFKIRYFGWSFWSSELPFRWTLYVLSSIGDAPRPAHAYIRGAVGISGKDLFLGVTGTCWDHMYVVCLSTKKTSDISVTNVALLAPIRLKRIPPRRGEFFRRSIGLLPALTSPHPHLTSPHLTSNHTASGRLVISVEFHTLPPLCNSTTSSKKLHSNPGPEPRRGDSEVGHPFFILIFTFPRCRNSLRPGGGCGGTSQ
jgi:hypothetical protein